MGAPIPAVWTAMIEADALFVGHSNFHHAPALFSCGIVVYPARPSVQKELLQDVPNVAVSDTRLTVLESPFWVKSKWWSETEVAERPAELTYSSVSAFSQSCVLGVGGKEGGSGSSL